MKKEIDWFGLWYTVARERGENDCPTLGKLNLETGAVEWVRFSHSQMDGIGALKKYYDQKKFTLKNLPELREKKVPGFFEALIILKKMIFNSKKIKSDWIHFNPEKFPEDPLKISWKIFSVEETELIDLHCKKNKFSINAYLINMTSKILLKELSSNGGGTWTVPVNLRPVLKRQDFYSNHSSGILIPIEAKDGVLTTQNTLKKCLKDKQHWAIWWVHQVGKIVGLRGMRVISKSNSTKNFLAGSFSNLGNWELPPNEIWIGCPPGSKNFPISIMVMRANDRFSFSLKVHPSILSDDNLSEVLVGKVFKGFMDDIAIG